MEIETLELIPKERKVDTKLLDTEISIKYLSRRQGGSDSKRIEITNKVEFTPTLIKAVAIYYGEGNSSTKRRLSNFVNSNPVVVNAGIKLFELLGINKSELKARVKVYDPTISDIELKRYWSQLTEIPLKNFLKTEILHSKPVYERNRGRPSKLGRLEVIYSSIIIKELIDNLIKKIKRFALENSEIRREFIKGLVAGEGSVLLKDNKRLQELRISSCDNNEQRFIRELLQKEGFRLTDKEREFYVPIYGFDNFTIISKLELFDFHPDKRQKFNLGFKNLSLALGE